MKDYFKAVTLGAFSFNDAGKAAAFCKLTQKIPARFTMFHFILITVALNFPIMLVITRLTPYEAYSRLYGSRFIEMLQDEVKETLLTENDLDLDEEMQEDFNRYMYQSGYHRAIMLPLAAGAFILLLIIQTVFYILAAFFMGLQGLVFAPLSFLCRLNFLLLSSTLPVFIASVFGLFLPTVHIIVFYLAVIIIGFHRRALCHNG